MLPRETAFRIGEGMPRGAKRQAEPAGHGAIGGQPSGISLKPVDPHSVLPVVTDLATEAVTRRRSPVAKDGRAKRVARTAKKAELATLDRNLLRISLPPFARIAGRAAT